MLGAPWVATLWALIRQVSNIPSFIQAFSKISSRICRTLKVCRDPKLFLDLKICPSTWRIHMRSWAVYHWEKKKKKRLDVEVPFHFVSPSERGFLLYAITLATWNLAWMHDWFSWVWPKNEFCCVSSSVFFLFLVSVFCLLAHVLAWNHICICIYVWIRIDVGPHVLWRWTQPHGRSSYRTEEILICPLLRKLLHALSIVISSCLFIYLINCFSITNQKTG